VRDGGPCRTAARNSRFTFSTAIDGAAVSRQHNCRFKIRPKHEFILARNSGLQKLDDLSLRFLGLQETLSYQMRISGQLPRCQPL